MTHIAIHKLIINGVAVDLDYGATVIGTDPAPRHQVWTTKPLAWGVRWAGPMQQVDDGARLVQRASQIVDGVELKVFEFPLPVAVGVNWHYLNAHNNVTAEPIRFTYQRSVVEPPPTINTVKASAYKAVHLASGMASEAICEFDVDGTIRGGFNAAHAAESGAFEIRCRHTPAAIRTEVTPVQLTTVEPGTDLSPLLVNGARLRLLDGVYTMSREVTVRDVIVVGEPLDTIIEWKGEDLWPGTNSPKSLINATDSAFWHLEFNSGRAYEKDQFQIEKDRRPALFQVGDDCTFFDVAAFSFGRVFNLNTKPKRVLIEGCYGSPDTRTYFLWFEGEDLVFYDNVCQNTIFEHIARGGPSDARDAYGWQRVTFDGNNFANQDNRPNGDPNDDAKGTIVMQAGRFGYRRNNRLAGPHGIGPLAVADAVRDNDPNIPASVAQQAKMKTEHIVVDSDIVTQPMHIWPGVSGAIVRNVPIEPKQPRNLNGPKTDPRRITGLKLIGVAAPTPQAWIDAAEVIAQ